MLKNVTGFNACMMYLEKICGSNTETLITPHSIWYLYCYTTHHYAKLKVVLETKTPRPFNVLET